jgi:hypothetical protein
VRDCVTLAADVVRGIRGTDAVDVSWASEDEAAQEKLADANWRKLSGE